MQNAHTKTLTSWVTRLAILTAIMGLAACAHNNQPLNEPGGEQMSNGSGTSMPAPANNSGQASSQHEYSDVQLNQRGLRGIKKSDRHLFLDADNPLSTRTIYFGFDSSRIPSRYAKTIRAHAHYLTQHPDVKLRLEGNTDERGTREYNLALGERRADSVKKALVLDGASSGQLSTLSFGEERPVCREHKESCWSQNRRVNFIYVAH